jgi:hypothetical protein
LRASFGDLALRVRALAGLPPAVERRRIGHPKALEFREFPNWKLQQDFSLTK